MSRSGAEPRRELHISPATHSLRGVARVPADKSISHRAAILGALAQGETRILNWLESETTRATVDCLRALGAEIDKSDDGALVIHGRGLRSLREPGQVLFCGGSGTTMRLLAGVCAGQPFSSMLDGTERLRGRPMARVIEPLRAMGATVLARQGGLAPLAIRGGDLRGIDYALAVASAQAKSAILLAGLFADSPTTVREPGESRDHTERMLRAMGAVVSQVRCGDSGTAITVAPGALVPFRDSFSVPGDLSSAAFLIVAAALVPGSEIEIPGVGMNPTRVGLLDALSRMGAQVEVEQMQDESGEPTADLVVRGGEHLRGVDVRGGLVPRMIDELPVLAVAATQAAGETSVRDAAELHVKESDRIGALVLELRKMGADIEERSDGFVVAGPTRLRGARVSARGDHRLAMSLAIAGLIAAGETVVEGWERVADSFPNFDLVLEQIGAVAW